MHQSSDRFGEFDHNTTTGVISLETLVVVVALVSIAQEGHREGEVTTHGCDVCGGITFLSYSVSMITQIHNLHRAIMLSR